jgi:hypothetical protein
MKKIAIEAPDEAFDYLHDYSQRMGKSIEELAAEVISSGLSIFDFNRTAQKMKERQKQWRRERRVPGL